MVSPPQGDSCLITRIRGGLHLNRDERVSLAAKAKVVLQLIHEVNVLLCWEIVYAFKVIESTSHRLR